MTQSPVPSPGLPRNRSLLLEKSLLMGWGVVNASILPLWLQALPAPHHSKWEKDRGGGHYSHRDPQLLSPLGDHPQLSGLQSPATVYLGEPDGAAVPWGLWGYLALRLLNLRGCHRHSVFQLGQLLVWVPGGLDRVLRVWRILFPSVRLACSCAHLERGALSVTSSMGGLQVLANRGLIL